MTFSGEIGFKDPPALIGRQGEPSVTDRQANFQAPALEFNGDKSTARLGLNGIQQKVLKYLTEKIGIGENRLSKIYVHGHCYADLLALSLIEQQELFNH